jgi:hypothetical protein
MAGRTGIVVPVCCVLTLSVSMTFAQIPQIERQTLMMLFNATNGPG